MGHLVGLGDPTMPPTDVAPQVPPHQSMGSDQETHLQAFSTINSKSAQDEGPKRGITWIDDSPCGMSMLKCTNCVHTHTLQHC
jgi:hypothetical protein